MSDRKQHTNSPGFFARLQGQPSTDEFIKGLWRDNPVFVQVLGMCPVLAVSNTAENALAMGLAALLAAIGLGLYLMGSGGPAAIVLGLVGVLLVATYTPWINRNPWLCLIAPGLGFGPVIVAGTGVVLLGHFELRLLVAALPLFFLTNNLLLLNQFPDREADARVGRRHLPIVLGTGHSARVFAGFLALSYASVVLAWAAGLLPATALLTLATLPLALRVARGALKHHDQFDALVPVLGQNVALVLLTGGLLAAGLFWAGLAEMPAGGA